MMTFCDTHTHLYDPEAYGFPDGCADAVRRAVSSGVSTLILPDCSSAQREMMFSLAGMFPDVCHPCIGLHPTEFTAGNWKDELDKVLELSGRKDIVAIGEIGMDLYHDTSKLEQQKVVFEKQLRWAVERELPVSLHIRSAYGEAMEILRKFEGTRLTGILHCFSGGIQEAEWAIRHNFLIGVGGVVTFKNNKLQEIVKRVGLEHIALETDSPFLSPTPYRGTRNESAYIPIIAQKVADVCECSIEHVAEVTTANVERVFDLKAEG
mgnify:CR=1 FL=1